MKTDNYLALCLEQAAKSPLHYRHGCIIVRGGKVVGQGYNDYRPGFDGGALKSGQVANGGAGGSSKQQRQDKTKSKPDLDNINFDVGSSFTPFEAIGGGAHANAPLSMHSEMMAVHSALSQSGTLACSAASHQKPCFKLPGGSKHKARLRTERIRAHVEEICRDALAQSGAASCGGQRQDPADAYEKEYNNVDNKSKDVAWPAEQGVAKHRMKNEGPAQHQKHVHSGKQKHGHHQGHHYHHAREKKEGLVLNAASLVPTGRAGLASSSLGERTRYPRLNGADLYVARLGAPVRTLAANDSDLMPACTNLHGPAPGIEPRTRRLTGSLHEELSTFSHRIERTTTVADAVQIDKSTVRDSRPCYRCVSYMNSVGIKRVFWTTHGGGWEGAKVRDMIEALDGAPDARASGAHAGIYVTKHEVLMLRRMMGAG